MIEFLLGAGVSWLSYGFGMLAYRQRVKNRLPQAAPEPKAVEAICGCKHHFALHDENGCHATDVRQVLIESGQPVTMQTGYQGGTWRTEHTGAKYQAVTTACGCKRYVGPEPLPTFYAPELES